MPPSVEQPRRLLARGLVVGLEDRPEPEDRDLPRVPIGQPVEGRDLAQRADPLRVPAPLGVPAAVAGGRQEAGEDPRAGLEVDVVGVPAVLAIGVLEGDLAARLEPLDGRLDRLAIGIGEVRERRRVRVEDQAVAGSGGSGGGLGRGALGCGHASTISALTRWTDLAKDASIRPVGNLVGTKWGRVALATVGVLLAALLLPLFLSSDSDPGDPLLTPLADAAEKSIAFPGARVTVEGRIESPSFAEPLVMAGAGAFNGESNRFKLSMHGVSGPPGADLDAMRQTAVGEGQVIYMRSAALEGELPGDAQWMSIDYSSFTSEQTRAETSSDPRDTLKQLRDASDVEEIGPDRVGGVRTTHYRAEIDTTREVDRLREEGEDERADTLEQILEANGATVNPLDVWVDDKGRVSQLSFVLPFEILGPGPRWR